MLSKNNTAAEDMIIYSAVLCDFEKPDFRNDALAGVRANYFNCGCSDQTEKTEIEIDGRTYSLSYIMKSGAPLAWKITLNNQPVQTVKRAADGGYSVISYGGNGIVYKRQYFEGTHLWLRTEYYSRERENQIAAVVYPKFINGIVALTLQRFTPSGINSADLYPSKSSSGKRCAALIYSSSGMLWYDASFKPDGLSADDSKKKGGFRFSDNAFTSGKISDSLDLKNAPYLSAKDYSDEPEQKPEEEYKPRHQSKSEPEYERLNADSRDGGYSAYDKIEQILIEAHKTNGNLFGELNKFSESKPEKQPEIIPDKKKTVKPELPEPEDERLEDAVAELVEAVGQRGTDEMEEVLGAAQPGTEEQSVSAVLNEPGPDSHIGTKNGSYAYYGGLDKNNRRSGRGRTVTPDGLTAYDGGYADDKRDGFGICYYKEGSPNYVGDWKSGSRSGRGVGFRLSDGTMHAGRWSGNKPDGFGARFDSEGGFLDVCTYVDGKRNGKSVSFDEYGNIVIRLWKDGEQVSEKIIAD